MILRHQGAIRGYLVALGCPAHLLDDLVQDVFLSVLGSRFEDRGPASTAAFLRTVARHLFLKNMQRERRQTRASELALAEGAWEEFAGSDGGDSYVAALRECLRGLRDRARAALELRYGKRLRREAIADRLGLSESGVKSILVRSKKLLRNCVERRLAS